MTGSTFRFVVPPGGTTATAAVRSVKFCVRAAHTRVTEKYDVRTAQHAQNGCVRSRIWEAA
ncbi:hypothetical protein CP967_11175 [Streptomyces nitrosporeus]|uniref:Uncharacterized protein n=1 Tax=Streptomyces nitrosporeus TaxID=28894 RepID=A0A5J6FBZ0_9ACTN|nr:hypothetical protein CP967_11175 [Streptomyces nitrosporeus]